MPDESEPSRESDVPDQAKSVDAPAQWGDVLKIKDNREPRILTSQHDSEGGLFLEENGKKHLPSQLRKEIEPWLTALFQSEYLSLLVGAGLPAAVQFLATQRQTTTTGRVRVTEFEDEIDAAAKEMATSAGRGDGNIEDQLRAIDELLRGLRIYVPKDAAFRGSLALKKRVKRLTSEYERVLTDFAVGILQLEQRIVNAPTVVPFNVLVNFLLSFASRSATRQRLHVFTTNYDRTIEFGAELAGLRLLDRFVGNMAPVFRSSRLEIDLHYNPPGIRGEPRYLEGVVHFTKLHGSLDWIYSERYVRRKGLPFGSSALDFNIPSAAIDRPNIRSLMIFPNAAKDRETAEYPYVELFRDFASAVCRPNSTLVLYGYSFGDEHINRVIEDMLTIPSTHLVVIAYDDRGSRIQRFYERVGRGAQFTLLLGSHFGDLTTLVEYYLPKPAIDRSTIRMAELLKARGVVQSGDQSKHSRTENEEGIAS
jgi:hypothetical protein